MNQPLILTDSSGMQAGEETDVVKVTTQLSRIAPQVLNVSSRMINQTKTGEVPVGGKFEVTYKYRMNQPEEGRDPGDAGRITAVEKTQTTKFVGGQSSEVTTVANEGGGSFAQAANVTPIGKPVVTVVGTKNDEVEVTKTETFQVNARSDATRGSTGQINFQVVVTDPRAPIAADASSREALLAQKPPQQPNPAIATTRENDPRVEKQGVKAFPRAAITYRNSPIEP
jgi:hypothetical protein